MSLFNIDTSNTSNAHTSILSISHVQAMIAEVDTDGNGYLDYDEFVDVFIKRTTPAIL